jgi:hypothetical protein
LGDLKYKNPTPNPASEEGTSAAASSSSFLWSSLKGLPIKKIPKNFLWCGTNCPLIIKDGQDAHPTKLGNLFFGVP